MIRDYDVYELLGVKVVTQKQVEVTVEKYVKVMLSSVDASKVRSVPARAYLLGVDESSPLLGKGCSKAPHRGVCQALYLATHVRPDVLCPTTFLTSRAHATFTN